METKRVQLLTFYVGAIQRFVGNDVAHILQHWIRQNLNRSTDYWQLLS